MSEMTEAQALAEARRRWGRKAQAVEELSTDMTDGHFRVGLYGLWRAKVEGIGRTWEEAFKNAVDLRSSSPSVEEPAPNFAYAALPWRLDGDCIKDASGEIVARLTGSMGDFDRKAIGNLLASAPALHAQRLANNAEITRLKMVVRQMSSLMRVLREKERA